MSILLTETHIFKANPVSLTEGKTSKRGLPLVEGILATAEIKNGNGRYYSKELWEREINKYLPLVKDNRAMGELDHPESSVINLKNVSHNISDMWWDGDNVMGKIEILSNPDSFMHSINESKTSNTQFKYTKVNSIISEILCSNGQCPII